MRLGGLGFVLVGDGNRDRQEDKDGDESTETGKHRTVTMQKKVCNLAEVGKCKEEIQSSSIEGAVDRRPKSVV
jgi:hypothetical protein